MAVLKTCIRNGHVQRMGGSLFDKSLFNPFNLAYDLGVGYRFHLRRVETNPKIRFFAGPHRSEEKILTI